MPPPDEDRPDRRPIPPSTDSGPATPEGRARDQSTLPTPARSSPAFAPGELIAGRFRIVRLLGGGGMGDVYEAEDLELRERVALKSIRADVAHDLLSHERFRREIQLARKVTHPNVCRTFDIERHRLSTGNEIAFVSMELLVGETLSERLRRAGRMTPAEALPIVVQMAAGLGAAHDAGIVHRDFKSANVLLVPGTGGTRAVITDFGLARGGGLASVSGSGAWVGTPDYMAPEQVAAGQTTPATDVYALGVVMYEMVTGTRPFAGGSTIATALLRVTATPTSPRAHVPDLDPKWEAVILRCLAREPADRFASAPDVARALAGEEVAAGRRALRKRRVLRYAGIAAVVLAAAGVGYRLRLGRPADERAASGGLTGRPVKPRISVALLGFKNLSGRTEAAWLSTSLAEMLSAELSAGEKLRLVPGENVARTKLELALPEADSLAKDTLARLRTNLGTDIIVLGSYFADSGGKVRLDVRLQDTAAGETIATVSETGTDAAILDLVSKTGARLRESLGVAEISAAEAQGLKASLPTKPEAARLFAEGLASLRLFDAQTARDLLEKAVAADPSYPLAHSALAAAWSALGYDLKAKAEARRAFDLSASLSREGRLGVEGRYRETTAEWEKAVEIYQSLYGFFPDNLEYGLRLAEAQRAAGKSEEALATVDALRKLPPPASEDPRLDLVEARAADLVGDPKRARAAAVRAAEKGAARGAHLLVARARFTEGAVLRTSGDPKDMVAAFEEARRIYAEAGDRAGVARSLNETAGGLRYDGELTQARMLAEQALAISREIGDLDNTASALNRIASVVSERGQLQEARRLYEEALAIRRELGDRVGEGTALNNIGEALARHGELARARERLETCLTLFKEIGSKRDVVFASQSAGQALYEQGELAGARTMFEQALTASRQIGFKSLSARALAGLGTVLLAEGDLAGARKKHEEALEILTRIGQKGFAGESRTSLAVALLEGGRPAEAEAAAREAADEFARETAPQWEGLARAVLAQSLSSQKKTAEALAEAGRAMALSAKSEYRPISVAVATAAARVRAASGPPAQAVKSLEATLAEATRLGLVRLQLEARLALGEIAMASGKAAAGRVRLHAVEKDATAKGFVLIARKAAALTTPAAAGSR